MSRDSGTIRVVFTKALIAAEWRKLIEVFGSTSFVLPLGSGAKTQFLGVGQDKDDFDWSYESINSSDLDRILSIKLSKGERIGFVLVNAEDEYDEMHFWCETGVEKNTQIVFSPPDFCPVIEGTSVSDFHRYLPSIYSSCRAVCAQFDLKIEQFIDR